ncbi:DUF58 domain-containing protein [Niallia sp. 01092]|uniref:DUF58 domain-containing protein n=1 Tax=unclassified Niallia TaxID=2837522 RepID=UPI003FD4D260
MNNYQQLLSRLQRKSLQLQNKKRGMQNGRRKSSAIGSSLEFSDYKKYQPGDDIRQIDWNVYGRTNKAYIKRFMDEKEVLISIFLDATLSMKAIASKWELAKQLAASLSFITLANEDRLFFSTLSSPQSSFYKKGAVHSKRTFYEIMDIQEESATASFIESARNAMAKKQQLTIFITDGLEPIEKWSEFFQRVNTGHYNVWFIQLLSEAEITPAYHGDIELLDSEDQSTVNVSMNQHILNLYKKRVTEHNKELASLCAKFGVHYILVTDAKDIQTILLRDFSAHGYIK